MGVQGDQKPYLDICDFISVRSPFDTLSGSETMIKHNADGSFEVKPSAKKRVSLNSVTIAQWIEGNTQIMARLLVKGIDAREYMSYTVLFSQLAQKYEWLSVLVFDREYRRLQANVGFAWGTDFGHLRDVLLVPKGAPRVWQGPGKRTGQRDEKVEYRQGQNWRRDQGGRKGQFQPQTDQRRFGQQGQQFRRDISAEGKFKLCRAFNADKCTRDRCVFKHFCAVCGSGAHGEVGHSKE